MDYFQSIKLIELYHKLWSASSFKAHFFKGYRLDKKDPKIVPSRRVYGCVSARITAQKKLPKLIFDFIDGAAGRETGLKNNQAAFDRLKLKPRVLSKDCLLYTSDAADE